MATYPAIIGVDVASAEQALQAARRIKEGYQLRFSRPTVRLIVDGCATDWEVDINNSSPASGELIVNFRFVNPRPDHKGRYTAMIRRNHGIWYALPTLVFTPEQVQGKDELMRGPDTVSMPALTI